MRWTCLGIALALACSPEPADTCADYMQEKCSDLVGVCDADPDCACLAACTGEHGLPGIDACLDTCGLTTRPAAFGAVELCAGVSCPDTEDECSTPADWMPPASQATCDGTGTGSLGDGAIADCGFDPTLAFDPEGSVLQLASTDGTVCVALERRDAGAGSLANTSWELVQMRVGPPGEVAAIDASSGCWYSSHHNFIDWVHASTAHRHYEVVLERYGWNGDRTYQLFVYEAGPAEAPASCPPTADGVGCIAGPIELVPVTP